MTLRESDTRSFIDAKLVQAGWILQNANQIDVSAGQGVAIREFPLSTGEADYCLNVLIRDSIF